MGSLLKPNLLDSDPWLWLSASTVGRGHPAAAGLSFGENPLVDKMIQLMVEQHQVDGQQLVGNKYS